MIRRYLEKALLCDFILSITIVLIIIKLKLFLANYLFLPNINNLENFSTTLITLSATLIGFLLTIITVIITFKKGFEEKVPEKKLPTESTPEDGHTNIIFDKKKSKEQQFYGSDIHRNVVKVFIYSAFEVALVVFILLLIQFNMFPISRFLYSLICIISFLMVILPILRSLYIFKFFLNVHLNDK